MLGSSTSWTIQMVKNIPSYSRGFHNASVVQVGWKHMRKIRGVQKHVASQMVKPRPKKGDPVLGRPNVPFIQRLKARIQEEYNQVGGLEPENTEKLIYGAEQAAILRAGSWAEAEVLEEGQKKREALSRIISMRNALQTDGRKMAIDLAVEEFGRFAGDTGSPEVQAAVATVKTHYVANHLKENRHDYNSQKKLNELVQGRQGILKYLKRTNPQRYFWTIEKLGLTDESVVTEFALSRKYYERVQFFGDDTLPVRVTRIDMRHRKREEISRERAKRYIAEQKKLQEKAEETARAEEKERAMEKERARKYQEKLRLLEETEALQKATIETAQVEIGAETEIKNDIEVEADEKENGTEEKEK